MVAILLAWIVPIHPLAALRRTLLVNLLQLMRLLVCATDRLISHLAIWCLLLQLLLEQLVRVTDYGLVCGWRLTDLSMGDFFDLLVQSFLRLLV